MQSYNQGYNQESPRGRPPNQRPGDEGSLQQVRERAQAGIRQDPTYDRIKPFGHPRYGPPPNGRPLYSRPGPPPNGRSMEPRSGTPTNGRPMEPRSGTPTNGRLMEPRSGTPTDGRNHYPRHGPPPNARPRDPRLGPLNSRPIDPRYGSSSNGRSNIPVPVARLEHNTQPNSRDPHIMQPPPPIWKTQPYGTANSSAASSREDLNGSEPVDDSRGELEQSFQFPHVPGSTSSSPQRKKGDAPPNPRNFHKAENSPSSAGAPGAKRFGLPQSPRPQQAPFKESPTIPKKPYDAESIESELSSRTTSRASSPEPEIGIVRQASVGHKGRPAIKQVSSWTSSQSRDLAPPQPQQRTSTINTISAAITAGYGTPKQHSPRTPQTQTSSFRMPFEESPAHSPTSVYTNRATLEPPRLFKQPSSFATPQSSSSAHSGNPLLGSSLKASMSDKIPFERRPPRLNIDAVRDAEARGSTTSMAELIRRATKLASNLDRGKTASRLGMLDMFNAQSGDGEKKGSGGISDMLSAFPPPGSSPSSSRQASRHGNAPAWGTTAPSGLRSGYVPSVNSQSYTNEKPKGRRICGMSMTSFWVVLFVVIILIAAAILVPVFLILLPKMESESSTSLAHCSTSHVCENMGISVINNNACGCICVNGYTGEDCSSGLDPDCTTTDVTVESTEYTDASVGGSIPALLSGSESNFSIPLNSTSLLALFSANNMTCVYQNSIVTFNVQSQNTKRFFPFPGLEDLTTKDLSLGALIAAGVRPDMPAPTQAPSLHAVLHERRFPRPSTVASSNGIVFQASTTTSPTASTATRNSPSASSSSPATSTTAVSQKTLSFAQVVVLYVLEQSKTLQVASNAQQIMQSYLQAVGGAANGTVQIGDASSGFDISADFANFEVLLGNGTRIGGTS